MYALIHNISPSIHFPIHSPIHSFIYSCTYPFAHHDTSLTVHSPTTHPPTPIRILSISSLLFCLLSSPPSICPLILALLFLPPSFRCFSTLYLTLLCAFVDGSRPLRTASVWREIYFRLWFVSSLKTDSGDFTVSLSSVIGVKCVSDNS